MPKRFSALPKEEGYTHVALLIVLALGMLGLATSSNIITTQKFPTSSSQVLGENETAQKAEERTKEASQKTTEQQKENQQINIQSEGKKQETEIQTSNGQKIKTKIEDNGAKKVEIEQGNSKLKIKTEKGQTQLEIQNEQDEKEEIENEPEDEGIEISTASGKLSITKNKISASTDFPISIDKTTHKLSVNTPNGQKPITILPDQATSSALLDKLDGAIKLEIKGSEMVYKVKGEKKFRIFGVIPVSRETTAYVSAESGNLVEQEQSLLTNLIKLISS